MIRLSGESGAPGEDGLLVEVSDLVGVAAVGSLSLAVATALWTLSARRRTGRYLTSVAQRLDAMAFDAASAAAVVEAGGSALITVEPRGASLTAGHDILARCAMVLGCAPEPAVVVDTLMQRDTDHRRGLENLIGAGEPCNFLVRTTSGVINVSGGPVGGAVWLRLTPGDSASFTGADARPLELLEALADIAWVLAPDGRLIWANQGWLKAVDAASLDQARMARLSFDKSADSFGREAAEGGPREALRWMTVGGARRAFRLQAAPMEGGGVAICADDVTEAEELREQVKRHARAHDETLNHIADGVAVFSSAKRLAYYNTAFAKVWGLEPAWLAESPTHSELLDRLRQRRRLPETADYAAWKARELAHYGDVGETPDDLWSLPDGRTLRVVRQSHPMGGILILFSDITGELRLKAQYNALIKVHQATLDKLNDAIAVFASDGRLRLHNEAFEQFWSVSKAQLDDAGDFDGVVELCTPRLHDAGFWRELKGRIADPDPMSRIATNGEARTSNDRIVSWQSRPLPDGATLIAFADVTEKNQLERAYQDRSAALTAAERLKRDFVGNVSYELRTPLTTIIGYSELLDYTGDNLPITARGYVAAVRTAATQLARSIDDVLDMAQFDAGEMALDLGDVPIDRLLEAAKSRFTRELAVSNVSIEIECAPEVGVIRADAQRMGQALDHLIENGIRLSPHGGVVTLRANRAGSEITLKIIDRGRGIPFHVQAHIFDRFVGREQGGPGLALALVKAIVELHGGWVALESEPGAGSTFTLHLPEEAIVEGAGQTEMF